MQSTKTLKRHADLVDRMADARGIDLEEEILRGNMSIPELDDAVLACTGCSHPNDCAKWLAEGGDPAQSPPKYCRNAEIFDRLERS